MSERPEDSEEFLTCGLTLGSMSFMETVFSDVETCGNVFFSAAIRGVGLCSLSLGSLWSAIAVLPAAVSSRRDQ